MIRPTLYLVALVVTALPVACNKKKDDAGASKSSAKKDDDDNNTEKTKKKKTEGEEPEEKDEPKAKATKGCKAPKEHEVVADWTIPEDCKLTFDDHITIAKGATITVGAGSKLAFASGKYLWVSNGKLVAQGTEEKPIVFTSSNSTGSPGDWDGLIYDHDASGGNVLDHVKIEFAGHEGGYSHGAVTVYGELGGARLSITNSTFVRNAQTGIMNDKEKSRFAKCEGNTFKDNGGAAMVLHPEIVGSVGTNKLDEPIKVKNGDITKSATWPKAPAFLFEDNVSLAGKGSAAILTLPDNAVLKFAAGKYLWIGSGDGGGLIGKGVKLTSANEHPAEGDWEGLIVDQKVSATTLEDCTIEYAGHKGGYAHAAVTFHATEAKKAKGFKMKNCTFKHNEHAAIFSSDHDCGDLGKDNKSEGQPICAKED
jgi:hypothetical protein